MGERQGGQERLFYAFNLEDHIPPGHLLRGIDQCLDLSELRHHLADFYSTTGRPSIDPELMIRMLIIGYSYGIRSERRLCEEVHLNLAYRWFCRLGIEEGVPDHSTFSKNRHGRFRESGAFRWLFDEVVRNCMASGLVKGEGFAVDASLIAANASHQHSVQVGEHCDWNRPEIDTRAMREYLAALDDEALAEVVPRKVSLSDPHSRWTAATGGIAFFAYSTNYLIDTAHGIILDVEATPAHRTAEVDSTKVMIERIEARFDLKPERLIADTAYGTAPMLAWMVDERASSRMFRSSTRQNAKMAPLSAMRSSGMRRPTNIAVRPVKRYGANGASTRIRAITSRRPTPSSIVRVSVIAPPAPEIAVLPEHDASQDRAQRP